MSVRIFMAISPNGFIARENGQEDWLSSSNWKDFVAQSTELDNFVIGRETYEIVKRSYGSYSFDDVPARHKVIVSRNPDYSVAGYLVVHSPQEAVDVLSKNGCGNVLVTGGAILNTAFLENGLVDELCLNVQPYLLGSGQPLLAKTGYESYLELQDIKNLGDGRLQIWYKVSNETNE